jgi:hypothetical protein
MGVVDTYGPCDYSKNQIFNGLYQTNKLSHLVDAYNETMHAFVRNE